MSKASRLFPSLYFRAADVENPILLTIKGIDECRKVQDETKPVMSFAETETELVLNKTNVGVIADIYGDETDAWTGKQIVLFKDRCSLQGKMTDCVRVREPKKKQSAPAAPPKPAAPTIVQEVAEDDVPF